MPQFQSKCKLFPSCNWVPVWTVCSMFLAGIGLEMVKRSSGRYFRLVVTVTSDETNHFLFIVLFNYTIWNDLMKQYFFHNFVIIFRLCHTNRTTGPSKLPSRVIPVVIAFASKGFRQLTTTSVATFSCSVWLVFHHMFAAGIWFPGLWLVHNE